MKVLYQIISAFDKVGGIWTVKNKLLLIILHVILDASYIIQYTKLFMMFECETDL